MTTRRRFITATLAAAFGTLLTPSDADAAPRKRKTLPARKPAATRKKPVARPGSKPAAKPVAQPVAEPKVHTAEPPPPAPQEVATPWRRYEIVTTLKLTRLGGPIHVWLPLPLPVDSDWQRTVEHAWSGNSDEAGIQNHTEGNLQVFHAQWNGVRRDPISLRLSCIVETRERQFDITRRHSVAERSDVLRHNLRSTPRLPTDGVVRSTAERIVGRIKDPLAQGKAIYDWVVDQTRFDPDERGNGVGDILTLLERPDTPGRCFEINGLFVCLARSIGLPARLTFGQRIDNSLITASLGQRGDVTRAQHCRAEFHAPGYGWVPVDPADVRKALTEDSGSLDRMKATVLRKLLFGFWEPNWVALNRAQDVVLRQALRPPLPNFSAPYCEIGGEAVVLNATSGLTVSAKRLQDSAG